VLAISLPRCRFIPTQLPVRRPREYERAHRDVRLLRFQRDRLELFGLRIALLSNLRRLSIELRLQIVQLLLKGLDVLAGAADVLRFLVRAGRPTGGGGRAAEAGAQGFSPRNAQQLPTEIAVCFRRARLFLLSDRLRGAADAVLNWSSSGVFCRRFPTGIAHRSRACWVRAKSPDSPGWRFPQAPWELKLLFAKVVDERFLHAS
jgi:hypothetical protein